MNLSFRAVYFKIAVALLILLSAGCAKKPEIPFDRSAGPPIKTIGLVSLQIPDTASVILASSVGRSFGLIGALVDSGMQANRESKFNDLLKSQSFVAHEVLEDCLKHHIEANGFNVTLVTVPRGHADYLTQYPKDETLKIDAYLDVVVAGYGYIAAGIGDSTPYRPAMQFKVRLQRASDSATLVEDTIIYDPIGDPEKVVTISPDPQFVFTDFDALMADKPRAAKGLVAAFDQSSDAVAKLLM